MGNLAINTDLVLIAKGQIDIANKDMSDAMTTLQSAITQLENNWDGAASTAGIETFYSLKSSYQDARFTAIQNYTTFLTTAVAEGYVEAETNNISLADAFL